MLLPLLIPVLFSVHQILVRIGSRKADLTSGIYLSILVSALIFSPSLLRPTLNATFVAFMLLAGFLHFFAARICFYHAIDRIGANLSAPLAATRVFFAALIGLAVGEELTPKVLAMSALVFTGIVLLSRPEGKIDWTGFLLGLATGLLTAVSSFLVKFGMEIDYNPLFATFLGFAISALLMTPFAAPRLKLSGIGWFLVAGITVAAAHLVRYVCLHSLPVVIVEPITSAYPLFTLVLSYIFIREREVFTLRSIAGAIAIVAGVNLYFF